MLGWGDEAEAALRSKLGDKSYEDYLKDINQSYGDFARQHPIIAPAAEFAGGAGTGLVTSLIPGLQGTTPVATTQAVGALRKALPFLKGAGVGGVEGAISGAGAAEEDHRGSGALSGGVSGVAVGAAVPALSRIAKAGKQLFQERINP